MIPRNVSYTALVALLALLALPLAGILAACSGGGPGRAQRTNTAIAAAQAGTATAAADAQPLPAAADIESVIRRGFKGLQIPYTATSIDTFRKVDKLVTVLYACDRDNAGGLPRTDTGFWPAVLGHCYTVGDATKWLYETTGRRDFAYANQMMMRFMRAKVDEANRAGAGLDDRYWRLVVGKIYTLGPAGTPVAATPLAP